MLQPMSTASRADIDVAIARLCAEREHLDAAIGSLERLQAKRRSNGGISLWRRVRILDAEFETNKRQESSVSSARRLRTRCANHH